MPTTGSQIHDCSKHYELKKDAKLFRCKGCLMNGIGERYTCNRCGRALHKECKDPESKVSDENFGGSVFKFFDKPFTKKNAEELSKFCDACGKDICGFNYQCGKLDLHPCCVKLEKEQVIDGTKYDLDKKVSSKCSQCGMKKIGDEKVQGWSYVSQCGTYHFHVCCIIEKKVELLKSQRPSPPAVSSTLVNVLNRRVVTATSNKMSITGSGIGDCHKHCHELRTCATLFQCYGCKMNGFGKRFTCNLCGRELHEECKYPESEVSHENFGGSVFKFYDKPFTKKNGKKVSKCCDACGKDICGFNYHCDKLDLHPCCARLEKKKLIDGKIFDLQTKVSSKCGKCEKKKISCDENVQGWSYVSRCKTYHLHVYCMSEMVQEAYMRHGDTALENVDLSELVGYNRNTGGGNTILTAIKSCVTIILSIILGDPTMLIPNVAVELLSRVLQL